MDLSLVLDQLQKSSEGKDCIVHWETIPPKKAIYADFPESLNFKLKVALEKKGINKLFLMNSILETFALILFEHFKKYPVLADVVDQFHLDESRHTAIPMNYAEKGLVSKRESRILRRAYRTALLAPALILVFESWKDFYRIGMDPIKTLEKFIGKVADIADRSRMPLLVDADTINILVKNLLILVP